MATSVDDDDEYEYDDESEAVDDYDDQNRDLNNTQDDEDEEDDYPVEEDDDDMMVNDTNTSMEWESAENPNAAPMGGRKGESETSRFLGAFFHHGVEAGLRNRGLSPVDLVLISTTKHFMDR